MHSEAPPHPSPACPPDPAPDRNGKTVPGRIASVLAAVRTLLGFGRHMAETTPQRAADHTFPAIAVNFGTSRVAAILAHLQRGILRAMALEQVLLERAAKGRDIAFVVPMARLPALPPLDPPPEPRDQPADTAAQPPDAATDAATDADTAQPAAAPPAHKAARRPSRPAGWDDPELFMPTFEELLIQVRRRPIGRTMVEICLDLGAVPGLCTGDLWNVLFDTIRLYGGSLTSMMEQRHRRQEAFEKEQDRRPGSTWQWWNLTRQTIRQVLGFFIGEPPVNPFAPPDDAVTAAAAATGPP